MVEQRKDVDSQFRTPVLLTPSEYVEGERMIGLLIIRQIPQEVIDQQRQLIDSDGIFVESDSQLLTRAIELRVLRGKIREE